MASRKTLDWLKNEARSDFAKVAKIAGIKDKNGKNMQFEDICLKLPTHREKVLEDLALVCSVFVLICV